ncbi:MAG: DUF167 domain-containing protein [Candidatus Hydrogenedentes bacterium]|nr:DUF167 domain-containing protein [Candidatus Hydrogenedentota bacterium]MBI3119320.1 DUF167 domain-containing protein [Candidatus Hydrogenedentota bacterium]
MQALEAGDGFVLMRVRVQPRASKAGARLEPDGRLRLTLTAPPVEGAANKAACEYVAKQLRLAKSAVRVVAGEKSRDKTLRLDGVARAAVEAFMAGLG